MHDPLVVLQEGVVVGDHLVPVVEAVEPAEGVGVRGGEAVPDEVLLSDDDQLPGGQRVAMVEEVAHRLVEISGLNSTWRFSLTVNG